MAILYIGLFYRFTFLFMRLLENMQLDDRLVLLSCQTALVSLKELGNCHRSRRTSFSVLALQLPTAGSWASHLSSVSLRLVICKETRARIS